MANKTRKQQRKAGFKLEPMIPTNVRIPAKTRQKLVWKAEEEGLQIPDVIRAALAHATRDVKAPKKTNAHELTMSDEDWAFICEVATRAQKPIEKLILQIVAKVGAQLGVTRHS